MRGGKAMDRLRRGATRSLAGLLGAILLAWGGMAFAEDLRGLGVVTGKDVVARTVTLSGGAVLQVTEATRIADASGRRLTLEELSVAPRVGGGVQLTGDATVRYEATRGAEGTVAHSIAVLGRLVQ
jgi:hypothetical protein